MSILVTSSLMTALTMSTASADPKFLNVLNNNQWNDSVMLNSNSGNNFAGSSVDNKMVFNDKHDNAGLNKALAPDGSANGGDAWAMLGAAFSAGGSVTSIPVAAEIDNEAVSQDNDSSSKANVFDINAQAMFGGMQSNSMGDFNAVNNDIQTDEDVINQNCIVCGGNSIHKAYMDSYTKSDYSEQYRDAVIAKGGSYATDDGEIYSGYNIEKGPGNINDGNGNENGRGHIDNDHVDTDFSVSW